MHGAKEYARMFDSGYYCGGKLRISSGSHARGKTFQIFIGCPGTEVEVYGAIRGRIGWDEEYGWVYKGKWQKDFERLVEERKLMIEKMEEQRIIEAQKRRSEERKRADEVMKNY